MDAQQPAAPLLPIDLHAAPSAVEAPGPLWQNAKGWAERASAEARGRVLRPLPGVPERLGAWLGDPEHLPHPLLLDLAPGDEAPRPRRATRRLLELAHTTQHPLTLATSITLPPRLIEMLGRLGRSGIAQVVVILPSLDPRLAETLEPGGAPPARRVALVRALAALGVAVEVRLAPLLPTINDDEIALLAGSAAAAGARSLSHSMPDASGPGTPTLRQWLVERFPTRAPRVLASLGPVHRSQIERRVRAAVEARGLARERPALKTDRFRPNIRPEVQLSLDL